MKKFFSSYYIGGSLLFQSDRFTYEGARALGNQLVAGCNLNSRIGAQEKLLKYVYVN